MRWYFKRKTEGMISSAMLYSYEALIAGLVSLGFFLVGDSPGTLKYAKMCTCIFMGLRAHLQTSVEGYPKTLHSLNIKNGRSDTPLS